MNTEQLLSSVFSLCFDPNSKSDCTVVINNKPYCLHREVLKRKSLFFDALFRFEEMNGSEPQTEYSIDIPIREKDDAELLVKIIILYMYDMYDMTKLPTKHIFGFLQAARYLQLQDCSSLEHNQIELLVYKILKTRGCWIEIYVYVQSRAVAIILNSVESKWLKARKNFKLSPHHYVEFVEKNEIEYVKDCFNEFVQTKWGIDEYQCNELILWVSHKGDFIFQVDGRMFNSQEEDWKHELFLYIVNKVM